MSTLIAEVKGSGKKPYELRKDGVVLSCSCPAWRNQSHPIDRRTCKHLKSYFGEVEEVSRTQGFEASVAVNTVRMAEVAKGRKLRPDEKVKLNGPPILLAHPWTPDIDPSGWWMSEKLDGVRAYWDGKNFISRQGNTYHAPAWFKEGLPNYALDGELWMARQKFQETMSVVRSYDAGDEAWKKITYKVFDLPSSKDGFEDRQDQLDSWHISEARPNLDIVPQGLCLSFAQLREELEYYEKLGAEGVMLRKAGSLYEVGRSHTCLKVKSFHDSEAVVVGHSPGKGRHKGRCGALVVRMPDGKEFSLGTGLSDKERESPPKIGSVVTYQYTETTKDGIPKCGSFVCIRDYD